ncbi:MAG TPA: hypothetical protein VF498_02990 [Anaerolineales bacterium]
MNTLPTPLHPLPRDLYLRLLRAALGAGEYRFAREAALNWLAAYPGDLPVSLAYAQALIGDRHPEQALPILERLCQADPEYVEAQDLQMEARRACRLPVAPETLSNLMALGSELSNQETIALWGRQLWTARQALKQGDAERAELSIRQALVVDLSTPLVALTHLEILEAAQRTPLAARRSLAEFYHQRWPDCIPVILLLADWLMDGGESAQAVALLHQAAARDVSGQAAARLWGPEHPYRAIWPSGLEASLRIMTPAPVAAALGWNRLAATNPPTAAAQAQAQTAASQPPASQPAAAAQPAEPVRLQPANLPAAGPSAEAQAGPAAAAQPERPASQPASGPSKKPVPPAARPTETLQEVTNELERVAGGLNRSGITRTDGRFPVYVVFSVRAGLESHYGPHTAAKLEAGMKSLVEAVQARPGWDARLFLADDPSSLVSLGIKPARPGDAWELKLALADLDAALAKKGEMIGALLIVGGPEVVPFHNLPNPIDDDDADVPSDNPYSTRDENYFIPEWPVGRLPGGAGNDPALLFAALQRITAEHRARIRRIAWHKRWWLKLTAWMHPRLGGDRPSLGYTAAIWRKASLSVYRPIGEPQTMLVSPPLRGNGLGRRLMPAWERDGGRENPIPVARLGYFNLHGLADSGEWYGQRDPLEHSDGPDYPVALRPQDIVIGRNGGSHSAPQVIFSEACYGVHILGKSIDQALALKFLAAGSQAVAGSTCMAYGSVSTPLIAADLLGHSFWHYLRHGLPAGEALRRAKIQLAREMTDRQGYLDGEDQKTLISFVLYGDPLAQPLNRLPAPKKVLRPLAPPASLKTVCDRSGVEQPSASDGQIQASPEVLSYVKHVVAQYLPGMEDANLTVSTERTSCSAVGHVCPTGQIKNRPLPHAGQETGRRLITLSKTVLRADHVHPKYARLTLDAEGKLVKLVVSR